MEWKVIDWNLNYLTSEEKNKLENYNWIMKTGGLIMACSIPIGLISINFYF